MNVDGIIVIFQFRSQEIQKAVQSLTDEWAIKTGSTVSKHRSVAATSKKSIDCLKKRKVCEESVLV